MGNLKNTIEAIGHDIGSIKEQQKTLLSKVDVKIQNDGDPIVTKSRLPEMLTSKVGLKDLNFIEIVKQILDENTIIIGRAWSGNGYGVYNASTWATYPRVDLKAGVTYGLKNIRAIFTHYFDNSGKKLKTFSNKDEIMDTDYTPEVDGYILVTRLLIDPQSKIIQGGLSKAHYLENMDFGSSAVVPNIPFANTDIPKEQFGSDISNIHTTTVSTINNLGYMTPIKKWNKSRGFIDTIKVYVKNAGTYNFAIGNIDQNNLIVSPRVFQNNLQQDIILYIFVVKIKKFSLENNYSLNLVIIVCMLQKVRKT